VLPLVVLAAAPLAAEEGAAAAYENPALGIRMKGPPGWRMNADTAGVSPWSRLATFYDPRSATEAVLSARTRRSASMAELRQDVEREWRTDKAFQVSAVRVSDVTPTRPLAALVVEATTSAPAPGGEAGAAPVPWQVTATYWLVPGYEVLLYAKAKTAEAVALAPALEAMRQGFAVAAASRGPEGAGAYVDEERGWSCRMPAGYGVTVPRRAQHLVSFRGVSAEDPVLDVFAFTWEGDLDADARRVAAFYEQDLGGSATVAHVDVAGRPGRLVSAKAVVGGEPKVIQLAIVQRGAQEFFRVRATMLPRVEAEAVPRFQAFLADFRVGTAPR
jgi:hypothetical protein